MKNITWFTVLLLGLIIHLNTFAQQAEIVSAYEDEVFTKGKLQMPYRILLPKSYDANTAYPLLVFLHGSGERGNDNKLQLVHGAQLFLKEEFREKYPAIIVFPQCSKDDQWSNSIYNASGVGDRITFQEKGKPTRAMVALQKLIKKLFKTYKVERTQVYVGGLSMGGMGTFELVRRNPKMFAAAFPICGGAHPETAAKMTTPNWWVFHGDSDTVVPIQYSEQMVNALEKESAQVKFSAYPGIGHNSWDSAFEEPDLLPWLFSNKLK